MFDATQFHIGDVVRMRKVHPCGSNEWRIVRLGTDIGIVCLKCGRRVLIPRRRFLRQITEIVTQGGITPEPDGN